MARVAITPRFVREAVCPAGRKKADFIDVRQRGFLLEVRRTGGKTFYQRYQDGKGRERQFKIGPAEVLTLAQARRKARSVMARVILGSDPQAERRDLRSIPLLRAFVSDAYLPHAKTYKRSWRTDEGLFRVHIIPALGSKALDEIGPDAVTSLIHRMREQGYAIGSINRVVALLKHVFSLARKWKVPGVTNNPASGLSSGPEVFRNRFLSVEEIRRLMNAIEADENAVAAQAILLLLLTGARRNEITHARWENVDWDRRILLVPISKSGKPRAIVLSEAAIALLRTIRRDGDRDYIFPSPVTGRPSPSLYFPWHRIRCRAGLEDVRLHDLRHSFASLLVNRGVSLYVVQQLLGHLHARTTQRYSHLVPETLTNAVEMIDGVFGEEAKGAGNTDIRM